VLHVLLQQARLVDSEVTCAWAVSVHTVETFLGTVAKESPVSSDIRAFGAVICCCVVGLTTDMAADVVGGAVALISRV
jgi:hypothetical protein